MTMGPNNEELHVLVRAKGRPAPTVVQSFHAYLHQLDHDWPGTSRNWGQRQCLECGGLVYSRPRITQAIFEAAAYVFDLKFKVKWWQPASKCEGRGKKGTRFLEKWMIAQSSIDKPLLPRIVPKQEPYVPSKEIGAASARPVSALVVPASPAAVVEAAPLRPPLPSSARVQTGLPGGGVLVHASACGCGICSGRTRISSKDSMGATEAGAWVQ